MNLSDIEHITIDSILKDFLPQLGYTEYDYYTLSVNSNIGIICIHYYVSGYSRYHYLSVTDFINKNRNVKLNQLGINAE